jgi:RND family efflux transporter MFP subunit
MSSPTTIDRVTPAPAQPPVGGPVKTDAEVSSRTRAGRRILVIGIVAAVILAGALIAGTMPRLAQQEAVDAAAAQVASTPPRVTVAVAKPMAADAERVLPGTSLPLLEAAIYARTTGYLKTRLVDIGDKVKEGQLLAEISAPDMDDQLNQARANLALATANLQLMQANAKLAQSTLERDLKAGPGVGSSYQLLDQDRATAQTTLSQVESARATIKANEATVQRYADLVGFQKITAPFPGVITARNVDAGDLIPADSPTTTKELFHLMRTDILRVWVNVPQVFATGIKVGQEAEVYLRYHPENKHKGKVVRTGNALDPNTRTLLTEVHVPNPDDALRPGMYLQVKFTFDRQVLPVIIPAAALATRSSGPRVGVLDDQHKVQYRSVQLGRDFGAEIQVIAGLNAGETVVVHPGDDLPEGTAVEPVPLPTSKAGS